jgi:hypothetical protein
MALIATRRLVHTAPAFGALAILASRIRGEGGLPAEAWLIVPEGYSLPSKHTTLAVLAVGALAHTLGRPGVVSARSLPAGKPDLCSELVRRRGSP